MVAPGAYGRHAQSAGATFAGPAWHARGAGAAFAVSGRHVRSGDAAFGAFEWRKTAAGAAFGDIAPQADYEAAMQARDGLLLGWNKALGRLKRIAAVAYDDDKAGYRALFAPAKDLQIKKRPTKDAKRKSRPAARPAPTPTSSP